MKKGNIKENMLSLKSMKAELDLLKRQIPQNDPTVSSITENFDSNGNVKSITSRLRAWLFIILKRSDSAQNNQPTNHSKQLTHVASQ